MQQGSVEVAQTALYYFFGKDEAFTLRPESLVPFSEATFERFMQAQKL